MDWNILGHQWAVDLLAQHAAHGGLRHAYLFTGPSGVGRRTLALRLAQAVNCLKPPIPGQPCGTCPACTRLEKMQHPDLAIIQAEQVGGTLKVDQVRELQRSLSLAPYEARYRVALLLRFEEAHPSASNALLKTLEEPAPKVLLLLTAESVESLLPTIVSRCEVLRLRPLPLDEAADGLQRWGLPAAEARLLAHLSGGRPGYARRLHDQPELLEQRQSWLNELSSLLGGSRVERFAYAQAAARAASGGPGCPAHLPAGMEQLLARCGFIRQRLGCPHHQPGLVHPRANPCLPSGPGKSPRRAGTHRADPVSD